jgi:hypothetical protein
MKDLIKIIDASVIVFVFTHIFAAVGAIEAEISNFEVSKIDHSQSFALCMRKVLRKVLRKSSQNVSQNFAKLRWRKIYIPLRPLSRASFFSQIPLGYGT